MARGSLHTPLGHLEVSCDDGAIKRVRWGQNATEEDPGATDPLVAEAVAQLRAYFDGTLTEFSLPLRVAGSIFQQKVCRAMQEIPYGETCSYGDLSRRCDAPAQAIGNACGGNPIPIIIPCHRVLGANGLGGFSGAGGIEDKVWLLRHEGAAGLLI